MSATLDARLAALKDGGPAFPRVTSDCDDHDGVTQYDGVPGMSLRDYFAGQTMMGMLASGKVYTERYVNESSIEAYAWADAMLRAREATR